jgi:hypothetical protein
VDSRPCRESPDATRNMDGAPSSCGGASEKQKQVLRAVYPTLWNSKLAGAQEDTAFGAVHGLEERRSAAQLCGGVGGGGYQVWGFVQGLGQGGEGFYLGLGFRDGVR